MRMFESALKKINRKEENGSKSLKSKKKKEESGRKSVKSTKDKKKKKEIWK